MKAYPIPIHFKCGHAELVEQPQRAAVQTIVTHAVEQYFALAERAAKNERMGANLQTLKFTHNKNRDRVRKYRYRAAYLNYSD